MEAGLAGGVADALAEGIETDQDVRLALQQFLLDYGLVQTHELVRNLAAADRWLGLYDPINPDTRTVVSGLVTEVEDALGNLPPLVQGHRRYSRRTSSGSSVASMGWAAPTTPRN